MPQVDPALVIALMPAIVGLVNFVKSFGLTGKALTAASAAVGVAFALAYQLLPAGTFQIVLNGVVLGLAAAGLYDITQRKPQQ